jgi:hypothetical protein
MESFDFNDIKDSYNLPAAKWTKRKKITAKKLPVEINPNEIQMEFDDGGHDLTESSVDQSKVYNSKKLKSPKTMSTRMGKFYNPEEIPSSYNSKDQPFSD